jgi:hypothetical protein
MPGYKMYGTEEHKPPHGGTALEVKSSRQQNKANLPHFTALEVTAVNIANRIECLTVGATYAPLS